MSAISALMSEITELDMPVLSKELIYIATETISCKSL